MSGTFPKMVTIPDNIQPQTSAATVLSWKEFLETVPTGQKRIINSTGIPETRLHGLTLKTPALNLYCDNNFCKKESFFDATKGGDIQEFKYFSTSFLQYECRHCRNSIKLFALAMTIDAKKAELTFMKLAEFPPFGPHIPSRVNKLIGQDRDFFFNGFQAENLGMGIGAFGYYRRVIENQKKRIIDEIIKVCERIKVDEEIIKKLTLAKEENRFSQAMDVLKPVIPDVLKIDGHNPLSLLHTALSEGLHNESDDQCLELAKTIRIVMTALAERIEIALRDETELKGAISKLLNKEAGKQG